MPSPQEAFDAVGTGLSELEAEMPKLAAHQAGANLYGSPRLNPFGLLVPNELAMSRVIADLLDPRGSHGQGALFLNALCGLAGFRPVTARDHVKVTREAMTLQGRRIDILIETTTMVLGIEVKLDAGQQPNQLTDYLDEIRLRAGSRDVALVFMSDQEPETAKGEIVQLPLAGGKDANDSFANLIASTVPDIRSDRARRFVEDLISYLEMEFAAVPQISGLEAYAEAVETRFARGGEHRQAIAAVLLTADHLWDVVVDQIGDYLLSQAKSVEGDFETDPNYTLSQYVDLVTDAWPISRPSWPENCWIAIEAQRSGAQKLIVGVKAPDGNNRSVKAEHASSARNRLDDLTQVKGGGRTSAWWPWYQAMKPDQWHFSDIARLILEAPGGDVTRHPDIQQLGALVKELAQLVDERLSSPTST
ncbi:PD-(D/E)XK nuclease family protein [Caulobacter sp. BP25]|uniref:PDDEXK-like family protein n=1 Tax=Caulobacter sp. BP25 TaxID=2048900 RepID=UPI000C12DAC7|nr:PD-(D/E)XK nuclease family protein [Caulobacter sp. BP25]PHY22399.1 hypothetical protein CSW59_02990 [Caulobacter sp. BP25]